MNKQFVTYEIALKLKELKFDELCLAYYNPTSNSGSELVIYPIDTDFARYRKVSATCVKAPLCQQAIDWLLIKHNIIIEPKFDDNTLTAYISEFTIPDICDSITIQLEEKESFNKTKNAIYELREKAILEAINLIKSRTHE